MDKKFWKNKKVLLTGGAGFLGSNIEKLIGTYAKVMVPRSKDCDLRDLKNVKKAVRGQDIVIHLAAKVGGIGFNRDHPGEMFYDNVIMGANLIEEARKAKVKKFVALGTICAYPKLTPVPFKEKDLWNGYPEETNAPYGLAKKMLLVQLDAYRQEYGFNGIYLLPVNLYGPGDNFNPESSHVIPALIKKIHDAKIQKGKSITVWGTGKATREFLFVEDAAKAIVLAAERFNGGLPVNIGAGFEISIRKLVRTLVKIMDYKGKIIWDKTKPDGQPRRMLDTRRAYKLFGFKAETPFEAGLEKTVRWHEALMATKAGG